MASLVVVGMSGGVDSSVAAALLVQQGYDVVGVMLRLWCQPDKENENRCCTPAAVAQARATAGYLKIPFYVVDASEVFRQKVVDPFIQAYLQGLTPNPCDVCNRFIRWGFLLSYARAMGAEYLATGHYARVICENSSCKLLCGLDENKDQSYFLSMLSQEQLAFTLFPLGGYHKPEVRKLARDFNLSVADRKDSQDLCFVGDEDYRIFLERYAPEVRQPGTILDTDGRHVGTHQGLAFYTIGQRKGLGIFNDEPQYVLRKDLSANVLIIGNAAQRADSTMKVGNVNWLSIQPGDLPLRAEVRIRYRSSRVPVTLMLDSQEQILSVQFDEPIKDITPGQLAVFYRGELVICAGIIQV